MMTQPFEGFTGAFLDEIDAAKPASEWLEALAIATPRGDIQIEQSTVISLWADGKPVAAYTAIRSNFNTTYLVRVQR